METKLKWRRKGGAMRATTCNFQARMTYNTLSFRGVDGHWDHRSVPNVTIAKALAQELADDEDARESRRKAALAKRREWTDMGLLRRFTEVPR